MEEFQNIDESRRDDAINLINNFAPVQVKKFTKIDQNGVAQYLNTDGPENSFFDDLNNDYNSEEDLYHRDIFQEQVRDFQDLEVWKQNDSDGLNDRAGNLFEGVNQVRREQLGFQEQQPLKMLLTKLEV